MRIETYLLIDSRGQVEIRKRRPDPHLRQVAVRLVIDIDDKWFVRPVPSVTLIIPDDAVQPLAAVEAVPIEEEGNEEHI